MMSILFAVVLSCAVERGDVKNLVDASAHHLRVKPAIATVEGLVKGAVPHWSETLPRQEAELQVYVVNAKAISWKLEADGDVHLVLAGDSGATMIAEFPALECVAGSPYAAQLKKAHAAVLRLGKPGSKLKNFPAPVPVKLTCLFHYDKQHGQEGGALNGAELHPCLDFQVLK